MITYKQLTLAEIFEDCQNNFDNDKCRCITFVRQPLIGSNSANILVVNIFDCRSP